MVGMADAPKLTPMMQQYFEVKRGLPKDTLLLFRLGDFYELFFDDAVMASRILGLTLTRRQEHPMAGLPHHAAEGYIGKLLAAGKKVAVCDQDEPAQPGKLVRRKLTRILSSGTTLSASQLEASRNRYLCALSLDKKGLHCAWIELSTGEFRVATAPKIEDLMPVLASLEPSELLVAEGEMERWKAAPHDQAGLHALHAFALGRSVSEMAPYRFETASGARAVAEAIGVLNLQGFGLENDHAALGPAGALVGYATDNLCAKPENLRGLQEYRTAKTLLLDPATLRNLEIFSSIRGGRDGSLLSAMDRTATAAGARLLERWLSAPGLDLAEVRRRHSLVGEFMGQPTKLAELTELLAGIRDIPRIMGRLQNRLRNPRELCGIRDTLTQLPRISQALGTIGPEAGAVPGRIHELPALRELLCASLADEPPADVSEGNFVREGYDPELDRMRSLMSGNKSWLADLERGEQERTSIRSLKVRFTNNFGYYIEITKANLHLVPSDYVRRQTTVGGERYVTDALRQKEREILHAEENALAREKEILETLIAAVLAQSLPLAQAAEALAEVDVLAGWASLAREWGYCRPDIDEGESLLIVDGRHPLVEQGFRSVDPGSGASRAFVPNDTALACDDAQIALITGPNMAGKSTYIRQVALIVLMAQVGSWVPARSFKLGIVDRIFSRVGASDDLARGNSTFMVEMNETANILNNATGRSLIILDEIGRGTSTYDGLSIAWAVVEHLHRDPDRGPRTLFATHYQELTQLEKHLPRMRNFSVAVKEWNDEIVFVRRVVPGAADRSYGIQVARLAGLPPSVIERAKTILSRLEGDDSSVTVPSPQARPKKKITIEPPDSGQLDLL
jgi:DNA mismatch repair protein MutS